MLYGIDVSHYQNTIAPAGLTWAMLRARGLAFAMVRATYGTWLDPSAVAHIKGARDAGVAVGLYHFFRVGQSVTDQLAAYCTQAKACGLVKGDICPALDIEDDPKVATLDPSWSTAAQALTAGLLGSFGECMMYITQRDFGRMGQPSWVLERPLWVAHYTQAAKPATPGGQPFAIWQHRVGPYVENGPGGAYTPAALDQDVASGPLPLCSRTASWGEPGDPGESPAVGYADLVGGRIGLSLALETPAENLNEESRDDG